MENKKLVRNAQQEGHKKILDIYYTLESTFSRAKS
jgi:hypothetical protein